jgi:hypothetical protein
MRRKALPPAAPITNINMGFFSASSAGGGGGGDGGGGNRAKMTAGAAAEDVAVTPEAAALTPEV